MVSNEMKGTVLVILTAIISGVSIVVNRFFVVSVNPVAFTTMRALFIGLIFFFVSLYKSKFKKRDFKKASWKHLIAIGVIGGGIAFLLFFTGLKSTTSGRAAFLHKTLPLFSTFLAFVFLKERVTKRLFAAMVLMLLGIFVMESGSIGYEMKAGDLLVLTATVLWAVENTIAKNVMLHNETNWVVTFSRMFFGSLVLLSMMFMLGKTHLLMSLTHQQLIYIGVSTLFLAGYVLTWYWGLRFINLSKASTILLMSPVISLTLGYYWLGESLVFFQMIGSLFILIGAYLVVQIKSERKVMADEMLPNSLA